MTATALLIVAALLGHARAGVVELNCSDNATCIDNMAKEFIRSVRQQKTVRVFDLLTIEPVQTRRQARSNDGLLSNFLQSHAFSFDWNDFTFKLREAQNRNDALDLEVYESRTAKDVSEDVPKKSKSKVEEEETEDDKKSPKGGIIKRRAKKKIIQAVIPLLFGMKSAAVVIFAMALVTVLTVKAFIASKLALMVTIGMAVKRLYESYSLGVGLQNHPYLYSQYPIDFPSASSHAYSVSGVSPQFPEMYNPTALGQHPQTELLQHNDAAAQQSQQAPTVQLLNSTRASERWDGKSKLQKLLEPIVDGIKSYISPIANVFYAMPATFRGLSSDVTTMKTETEKVEEPVKKPREILMPQPRNIAQRKMNYRKSNFRFIGRPKKYKEFKIDLDKLKKNKDLHEYIKTKKYKYNYHQTHYYPRIKFYVNPNYDFMAKPKNNRLIPYKKETSSNISVVYNNNTTPNILVTSNDWKPVLPPVLNASTFQFNITKSQPKKFTKPIRLKRKRVKRNTDIENEITDFDNYHNSSQLGNSDSINILNRGIKDFMQTLMDSDPITAMVKQANLYTKSVLKHSLKSVGPPKYYVITYDILMMTLDVIDGLVEVQKALVEYFTDDVKSIKKKIKKTQHHSHIHKKKKKKPSTSAQHNNHNKKKKKEKLNFIKENENQEHFHEGLKEN